MSLTEADTSAILLTLKLAAITTALLMLIATPLADDVIILYRHLENRARQATEADMAKLARHLRTDG